MLKVSQLSVSFKNPYGEPVKVLNNISFEAKPGEFLHLIGNNGAGKSTLMNVISGILPPTEGDVSIGGKNLADLSQQLSASLISHVCQDPLKGTFPNLSIEENLAIAMNRGKKLSLRKALNAKKQDAFRSLLETFNIPLSQRLQTPVSFLSGGQRQILSILMAGMAPAKVLTLDEPTAALDPAMTQIAIELIRYIARKHNLIVIMITHDMSLVNHMGTRTLQLKGGSIKEDF